MRSWSPSPVIAIASALLGLGLQADPAWARPPGPLLDEVVGLAHAEPTAEEVQTQRCATQSLTNGVQLAENPDLYKIWHPARAWGRPELVELLVDTGEYLAFHAPHTDPFVVGDMSAQRGGPLFGHRSHRGGIDADVGLYWGEGQQHLQGFMDILPTELDVEATWLMIQGMLQSGLVERILLDQGHIDRIRAYTIESGELTVDEAARIFPAADSPDLWTMSGVVQHVPEHKNHLHVRVLCTAD